MAVSEVPPRADRDVGGGHPAEVDGGGPGEVGAGHRDRGAAGPTPPCGLTPVTVGRAPGALTTVILTAVGLE